ncbi:uncharacterized protein TRIVIDRAFT_222335 [Trichoderma virens Gv29-8]|uniref:N-acetyltransferase domain-containing protein n=1 Tax=Hypocrea virens (strain Gv29-8 / FGSC 10586) TaxID=413071 RepID=G9MSX9_HYPVG|nr:uncharacterized protein TRIVIDRAFT_222335 [Trichoderma virens Gv29-8]EHK23075.1 hypothetical protein TRIVIDRAFT_222335 [Trichoderma virens Gv29-8]UKZ48135.1 hypothetical protein TrVGV298_002371 [Trichoderma virens]
MEAYVRTLSIRDLDQCVEVESSAFPPNEAASRDSIEYRLTVCPEVCLGLFIKGKASPSAKLPDNIPYLSEAPECEDGKLVAHTLSTKSTIRFVKEEDMSFPSNWKSNPLAEYDSGHKANGRTIALHALAVSPDYQRRGLGKALMRSYIKLMKETNRGDRISILAHDHLIPYYESLGFRNLGRSDCKYAGEVWNDLECELSSPC